MRPLLPPRRLIPRWRPVAATLAAAESLATADIAPAEFSGNEAALEDSIAAWRLNPTAGHLGDVLAFGIHTEFVDAVLKTAHEAAATSREMTAVQQQIVEAMRAGSTPGAPMGDLASPGGIHPFQQRMRELRKLLSVAPDNPLVLLDFAQLKLAAGDTKTAKRILRGALSLAPRHRTIIRTISRFWVHVGEKDKAHAVVARALKEVDDPWLMASEIALAGNAERDPLYLQRARRILNERRLDPRHFSELAGAVASLDLRHGQLKSARENARLSLLRPNDNVIAQAVLEHRLMGISLRAKEVQHAIDISNEAKLLSAWNTQEIELAKQHAFNWHGEEPFSSRPIQFISVVSALQRQYSVADAWVAVGLKADPNDAGLWTNLAFTRAAMGQVDDAEKAIKRVRSLAPGTHGAFVTATEGLLALKRGDFPAADLKYRGAIGELTARGLMELAALCMAHYARWSNDVNHPQSQAISAEAVDLIKKNPSYDALIVMDGDDRLQSILKSSREQKLRLTSQLVLDPDKNTLTQISTLTRPGAPGFVIRKARS